MNAFLSQAASVSSDCAVSESCCESRCRSDCLGYLYFTESDRGSSKSSSYGCSDTTPIVTYVYRQRQDLRRGQKVPHPTLERKAPSYQHSHPDYPPPQYEHHQSASPPPYSFGATDASDHLPSYSVGIEKESGGVNSSKGTYGALQ